MKHMSQVPIAKRQNTSFAPESEAVTSGSVNAGYESAGENQNALRVLEEHDSPDLDTVEEDVEVECLAPASFLRRIPNEKPWGSDKMRQFAKQVDMHAEALSIVPLTARHKLYRRVKIYPITVVEWTYGQMAASFGWPKLLAALPEYAEKERAKAREKHLAAIQEMIDSTENSAVLESLAKVSRWLEAEGSRAVLAG